MDVICRHPGAHEPHILPLTVHQEVLIDLEQTYQRAAKRAYRD